VNQLVVALAVLPPAFGTRKPTGDKIASATGDYAY
jgi:hypothetical protein